MRQQSLPRLAILVSGNGSNLQAILDACASGLLRAEVAVVISNRETAFALERAKQAGVPALVKRKRPDQERQSYDGELAEVVRSFSPDWVVLAGWMRILSQPFLNVFPNRVVNLHPALPGTFPGTHAIERAFSAHQKGEITYTGVMVHLVPDEGVDCGPVLGQEIIPILAEDTLESLEDKVHQVEHQLIVRTLRQLTDQLE